MNKAYQKMPLPTGNFYFNGKTYPAWTFTQGEQSIRVSTTELQRLLFVGGDTGNDYVNDEAQLLDESIAYYVSPDDSVETVYAEVWDVKLDALASSPGVIPKWRATGNCVYNGDDLGSLVAECASRQIAEALVQYANGSVELRKRIAEAEGVHHA